LEESDGEQALIDQHVVLPPNPNRHSRKNPDASRVMKCPGICLTSVTMTLTRYFLTGQAPHIPLCRPV
jgi:hypothetical protein